MLKTDQRDTRLAYAREILAGAEQKLGVSASGNFYEGARAELRRGEVYCAQQSMGQMMSLLVEGMNGQDSSAWAAVLGLKDIGWEKAAQRGGSFESCSEYSSVAWSSRGGDSLCLAMYGCCGGGGCVFYQKPTKQTGCSGQKIWNPSGHMAALAWNFSYSSQILQGNGNVP